MGSFSLPHILILAVVAILLLGGGRFSNMMGDVAKGVKNFKKGMAEEDEDNVVAKRPPPRIEAQDAARPAAYDRDVAPAAYDRDPAPVVDPARVREDR